MLMLRSARILGGETDRADFDRTLGLGLTFGPGILADNVVFESINREQTGPTIGGNVTAGERQVIRDALNFGGAAARIEAQKTLEIVRKRSGLDYVMFR